MTGRPPALRVERDDDVPVARLAGEIDIVQTRELAQSLRDAIDNQDYGLVVDLREVTYLDSAGINLIFELAERLRSRQQRVALIVPERAVIQRVISLVDLASVAGIHNERDPALAEIRALRAG